MKTKGQALILFHYIEIIIASVLAVMAALLCSRFSANSALIIVVALVLFFLEGWLATTCLKKVVYWYESLLDAVPFPLSVTDKNMNWTFVNKPVENMLGKKRSELIGKHCSNWGADICKTCKCGIDCLRGGQKQTTFDQAGMNFQVDTSYLLDKKQRPMGHIEVVQDITALYRFRASLDLVQKINTLCVSVAGTADEIANEAKLLAQGSSDQAASVSELTSSIADISNLIGVNAQQASQAADLAKIIQSDAEKESAQMEKMMKAVQEISEAGQEIEKIIAVIDGIAFQTNILALNAAVEAARAGQHGKGFAVVAEEVRSLAARSAEAANNTKDLIANSITKSTMGATISNEAVDALRTIIERIKESGAIIMSISESAHRQNENIKHIRSEIEHVSLVVQQNSSTAQKSSNASDGLNDEMNTLRNLLEGFNDGKM